MFLHGVVGLVEGQFLNMRSILILLLLSFMGIYGNDHAMIDNDMRTKIGEDPLYQEIIDKYVEEPWTKHRDELAEKRKRNSRWSEHYSSDLIEIPVVMNVIHVLYENDKQIIGNEQIQSEFRALNDAFFDINYWDKSVIEEYEMLSANFSMQFKLSNVEYSQITDSDFAIVSPAGWQDIDVVRKSPNYDQNHYLHFYIVPKLYSLTGTMAGESSFPFPTSGLTFEKCLSVIFNVVSGEECLQYPKYNDLFVFLSRVSLIGYNGATCMDALSANETPPP
eukprot:102653_1